MTYVIVTAVLCVVSFVLGMVFDAKIIRYLKDRKDEIIEKVK